MQRCGQPFAGWVSFLQTHGTRVPEAVLGSVAMLRAALVRPIALTVLFVALVVGVMAAQSARSGGDVGLRELLEEVRAMRGELRQVASSSMRMQLLVARLSLQEGRIAALVRELAQVHSRVAAAAEERSDMEQDLTRSEESLRTNLPREVLAQIEGHIKGVKARLASHHKTEQQLRTEENELNAQLLTEQSRWVAFNSQLDELERALPR